MSQLLYATPYEQEMLTLSREILRDTTAKYQIMSPALAVLECSEDEKDIELCKSARTRMQIVESRFEPVKTQHEIDADDLATFIDTMQTFANRAVIGAVVVLGAAFVIGQVL